MPPEEGQNLRVVKDGGIRGNPDPHLDIENVDQIRSETAQSLVSRPPNHHRRTLNATACRHAFQPAVQHAWGRAFERPKVLPVAIRITDCKSAKGHAHMRIAANAAIKMVIKTRQHYVVLVQDVHPFSTSPLDAP